MRDLNFHEIIYKRLIFEIPNNKLSISYIKYYIIIIQLSIGKKKKKINLPNIWAKCF